ncbi:MAG: hypothetical protein LBS83_00830 [Holosporales bacterium]|nr:hypothetical protein [Holosporales bacterium]
MVIIKGSRRWGGIFVLLLKMFIILKPEHIPIRTRTLDFYPVQSRGFTRLCLLCFTVIPKPQKIADSNFLGFKGLAAIKSAFFWGPSILGIYNF